MKPRHKRLAVISVAVVGLSVATIFVVNAFRSNIVFFYSPTEVLEGKVPIDKTFRVGGLVEAGSVKRGLDGLRIEFVITDMNKSIPVRYSGILPDLFREGQGVVAQGRLTEDRHFAAAEVLAKHDEKYMPPEAAAALQGAAYKTP